MRFSEHFNIENIDNHDFFDRDLLIDTSLFINPFLIFYEEEVPFLGVHNKLINFFNEGFRLAIESKGNRKSIAYRKLENMMIFPEIDELALGYSQNSTKGSGASTGFRNTIINGIFSSLQSGIDHYKHFEEIGIFSTGIGCDRISDITANIIMEELVEYTQLTCNRIGIEMKIAKVSHSKFDFKFLRWCDSELELPINPFDGKPILLIPKRFLDELPTISAEEFWDYVWDNKNETLRNDLNYELKSQASKSDKVMIAKNNPDWVLEFMQYQEKRIHTGYDFESDRLGVYNWDKPTRQYIEEFSTGLEVISKKDFFDFVKYICNEFKLFVEDQAGYKLLWDDNKNRGKKEEASQLLFHGIVRAYCKLNNIDITREANIGRGPVDFKFSKGYEDRVLLEVKLARNSSFWDGLEKQLPQYLKSEEISKGIFMVIVYKDEEYKKISEINAVLSSISPQLGYEIDVVIIDAINNKTSASNL